MNDHRWATHVGGHNLDETYETCFSKDLKAPEVEFIYSMGLFLWMNGSELK
jgi:hypothetical protein